MREKVIGWGRVFFYLAGGSLSCFNKLISKSTRRNMVCFSLDSLSDYYDYYRWTHKYSYLDIEICSHLPYNHIRSIDLIIINVKCRYGNYYKFYYLVSFFWYHISWYDFLFD